MTTISRFNHISIVAVVAIASLVTAACGGDEDSAVIDTPSTTTVVESAPPVQEEHPCDTPQAEIHDDRYCYVDGQWYADAGAGHWIETDGPPATTTVPSNPLLKSHQNSEVVDVTTTASATRCRYRRRAVPRGRTPPRRSDCHFDDPEPEFGTGGAPTRRAW